MANFWKKFFSTVKNASAIEHKLADAGVPIPPKVVAGTEVANLITSIIEGLVSPNDKITETPKVDTKP